MCGQALRGLPLSMKRLLKRRSAAVIKQTMAQRIRRYKIHYIMYSNL